MVLFVAMCCVVTLFLRAHAWTYTSAGRVAHVVRAAQRCASLVPQL
jgi:hypothetical protein